MNLNDFSKESITRFGMSGYECCDGALTAKTERIIFEGGAIEKIGQILSYIVPPPSLVAVVSDPLARSVLDRIIEKRLHAAGFRVVSHIFDSQLKGTALECSRVLLSEDVRLVVGAGGAEVLEAAKYIATAHGAECALVPTQAILCNSLSGLSRLLYNGTERLFETVAPRAVILDTNILTQSASNFTAAAFGELCSKLTALFDRYFAHIISGGNFCPVFYNKCIEIITDAIDGTAACVDEGRSAAPLIAEQCLKLSALSQLHGKSFPLIGADSQTARALELLYRHEERETRLKGENEFLFARILLRVYRQILTAQRQDFMPPPDNNARISILSDYFGLDENRAMEFIRPIASANEIRLNDYRLNEYRPELLAQLTQADRLLTKAWRPFKRLYEDDGYSLLTYLDPTDIALCIAIAPDVQNHNTVLTYLKNAGRLEQYIVQ